jgi:hypothetical protein
MMLLSTFSELNLVKKIVIFKNHRGPMKSSRIFLNSEMLLFVQSWFMRKMKVPRRLLLAVT